MLEVIGCGELFGRKLLPRSSLWLWDAVLDTLDLLRPKASNRSLVLRSCDTRRSDRFLEVRDGGGCTRLPLSWSSSIGCGHSFVQRDINSMARIWKKELCQQKIEAVEKDRQRCERRLTGAGTEPRSLARPEFSFGAAMLAPHAAPSTCASSGSGLCQWVRGTDCGV